MLAAVEPGSALSPQAAVASKVERHGAAVGGLAGVPVLVSMSGCAKTIVSARDAK